MQLAALGEFGLINRISPLFRSLIPEGVEGIGDDCAIIPISETESLVVTTDLLVEDVHFLRNVMPAYDIGWKSLAVNLSDVAAMGATPVGTFLSIGLPSDISVEWTDSFFEGLHSLSAQHNVPLLGGDTTRSPEKIVINITVVGKAPSNSIKRRSAAKLGDIVATTGFLGNSAAGLWHLLNNSPKNESTATLIEEHFRPKPYLHEGQWLANQKGVNAMMDISDGISSDLRHILKASNLGACVEMSQLPISPILKSVANSYPWDILNFATSGGEDYCLLVTIARENFPSVASKYYEMFNHPLSAIGEIQCGPSEIEWKRNGITIELLERGFQHF